MRVAPTMLAISPAKVAERSVWLTAVTHCSSVAMTPCIWTTPPGLDWELLGDVWLVADCWGTSPRACPAARSASEQTLSATARLGLTVRLKERIDTTSPLTHVMGACFALCALLAKRTCVEQRSGDLIERPVAPLGHGQPTALRGDGSALDAVRVVDDHVYFAVLGSVLGDLIDPRGAHPAPRLGELARHAFLDADVVGSIVACGVTGDEHRGELVECVFAVGLGIALPGLADEHRLCVVAVERPATAREATLGGDHEVDERPAAEEAFLEGLARVALFPEVFADDRVLDHLLVVLEARLTPLERRVDRLGGEHAGLDRVVDALQRGEVHDAGGVADEHGARHRQLGHRPVATRRQRLGAPGDPFAALEHVFEERMRLDLLEEVVRRGGRVGVVEVDNEADADEVLAGLVVLHRIHPRAADLPVLGGDLQRPAGERVNHAVQRFRHLPDLLDPELPYLGFAVLGEVELLDRGAGDVPPAALGENRGVRLDIGARLEVAKRLPLLAATLVTGAHADDASVFDDQLRGGGLGEDVRAGLLGLALLEARERGDRDDLVAVVVLGRRGGDAELGLAVGQDVDRLLRDFAEGKSLLAPLLPRHLGEQLLQRPWAHDGARQVVPAAGLGLLDDRDGNFAEALHRLVVIGEQREQAIGAGQPGGAATDDDDAHLDQLVLGIETPLDEFLLRVDRRRIRRRYDLAVARAVSGHLQSSLREPLVRATRTMVLMTKLGDAGR